MWKHNLTNSLRITAMHVMYLRSINSLPWHARTSWYIATVVTLVLLQLGALGSIVLETVG